MVKSTMTGTVDKWRLQVAAELQQQWRRTNRQWKSNRESSITQNGASCGRYNQRRREALRRRQREPMSAIRWRVSARYDHDGTMPLSQKLFSSGYWRTHYRNWILSKTFSQCSLWRSGVTCFDFLTESTSPVAALKTDCSCCNSCPEMPQRTELQ